VSKLDQRRATAYHEAGHVVAAIIQGIRLGRKGTSIIPEVDSAGRAYIRKGFKGTPNTICPGQLDWERNEKQSCRWQAKRPSASSVHDLSADTMQEKTGIMLSIS
jgi:hypothetical protein